MKRLMLILIFVICLFTLTGCAQSENPMDYRWASISGAQISKTEAGEEFYFNVPVDQSTSGPDAIPVKIRVSGNVSSGSLRFELRGPDGVAVWNSGTIGPGDYSIKTSYVPPSGATGTYTLGLMWGENTNAAYNLDWQALQLTPAVLFSGVGMTLVALAFVIYTTRRRLGWRYLGLGALFWVLTVAAKFAFAIPINPMIYQALKVSSNTPFAPGNLVAYVYIGALTGFFEAGLAYGILRRVRWGRATWQQALAFGIGFGVIEALLLGLISLVAAAVGLIAPDSLDVPTLASLAKSGSFVMALAPVVERLSVIFAHIFACVLVFYAIAARKPGWAWLAILYKTILDAPAGFAQFWGVNTPERMWIIEAVILVMAAVAVWGTLQIARRYPPVESEPAPVVMVPEAAQ